MKAWELLSKTSALVENEQHDVESDLNDLIVASKANGITELDVAELADQLNNMGHSVTDDSIVNLLDRSELEILDNVTLDTITLKQHTADEPDLSDDGDFEDEVSSEDLAKKSAMKGIKKRQKTAQQATKDARD